MKNREKLNAFQTEAAKVILDKNREITLALCCLLARGHLLIEDIPGVGKTTMVLTLAKLLDLKLSRVQFTNDLLPADILGSSIFDAEQKKFRFHPGPIFSQLVLADELNRATPKTQSACLQAMEERRVTVDGETHALPHPFIFVATQNPKQQIGTFLLPESQLDRFLMRIEMGYPNREAEKFLLMEDNRQRLIEGLKPVLTPDDLIAIQNEVRKVHASDALISYLQDIVAYSREGNRSLSGLSPRASIGFLQAAKAWAYLRGSDSVLPEDVQAVAIPVMAHRLNTSSDLGGKSGTRLAQEILAAVPVDQKG
jgi:MoxR-like ATPase